jgi:ABC-2 type transport system ATP-binding protein
MLNIDSLTRRLEKVFERRQAAVLAETITEAYTDLVKTGDFNELKEIVKNLGEAQGRTELRLQELTAAQQRTEVRLEELAAAQQRTEVRLEELTVAQQQLTEANLAKLTQTVERLAQTVNVDVQSRAALWERIRQIARDGKTALLTTNYMEEAQALADHLAILDHGQLIANGTPAELRSQLGQTIVEIEAKFTPAQRESIAKIPGVKEVKWQDSRAQLVSADGDRAMPEVMTWLQAHRITPRAITMRQPDLNDVFLKLTGRALRD